MQVLVALAEAAGETVTRDQLIDRCWDGRIVSQDAINRVVLRIRRASRQAGAGSFSLQTIPKIGFRLLVGEAAAAPDQPAHEQGAPAGARFAWPSTRTLSAAASLVAALTGAVVLIGRIHPAAQPPDAKREAAINLAVRDLTTRGAAAVFEGSPLQAAQGIGYFRAAVRQKPDSAALWGSLAMATVMNQKNLPPSGQIASGTRIREAAEQALKISGREPHAWAALTSLSATFGAWPAKDALVARGLAQAAPDGPPMLRQQTLFLAATGRTGEALESARKLYRLHPLAPFVTADLLRLLTAKGRFEEADAVASRAAELWPRDNDLWLDRFVLALAERDTARAQAMVADRDRWPAQAREADMVRRGRVARVVAGDDRAADAALAAYGKDPAEGQGYLEEGIVAAAALNRPEAAFRLAQQLYGPAAPVERFRFADHLEYALAGERRTDLLFGPFAERLWGDPRFLPLTERIGLASYWRKSRAPDLCRMSAMQAQCARIGLAPAG